MEFSRLETIDSALKILDQYNPKKSANNTDKIDHVMQIIKQNFQINDKKCARIQTILESCRAKGGEETILKEADRLLLRGLFMKAGIRMGKKLKEWIDFESGACVCEELSKALIARRRREERILSAQEK